MPDTMPYVEEARLFYRQKENLAKLKESIGPILAPLDAMDFSERRQDKFSEMVQRYAVKLYDKYQYGRPILNHARATRELHKKSVFHHPCPTLACRGFLKLDEEQGTSRNTVSCAICEGTFCKKCVNHLTDEEEHTCDEDTLASVQAIRKQCRSCPQCKTPIYRIDGCSQMWCTQCRVTFNWNTGEVDDSGTHNPHFFDWLHQLSPEEREQHRRTQQDMVLGIVRPGAARGGPCDIPLPRPMELREEALTKKKADFTKLMELYRKISHYTFLLITEPRDVEQESTRRTYRVRYMLGEINETYWMQLVAAAKKKAAKQRDERALLELWTTTGKEMIVDAVRQPTCFDLLPRLRNLEKYIHEEFQTIGKLYRTKPRVL